MERTVEQVLPALQTNSDGLKQVLDELLKQYKSKETEMNKWKVRVEYCSPQNTQLTRSQKKNNVQIVQNP